MGTQSRHSRGGPSHEACWKGRAEGDEKQVEMPQVGAHQPILAAAATTILRNSCCYFGKD